ncbi:NAD/NADP octopine/nopaline dehydrogenase family protein [Paraliomyxa miuraensis]|uniref:NAD/NADP octopine/nopaline dehydrogenase family protein n=1 Tax=Paraliomyxa miuraensis TaxID=376150 RepID=UPI002253CCF4|nr:NAD/NADP octopine/nopaline dehydrogenase family protein [Paraliomyxa miuraensis]MCX4240335.1 NAD/NADP octopine/nopaline dehydrogenase family protein [Paraliomyxa miuraensis]
MGHETVIVLCTGSSGNHVLAADLGRDPGFEVRLVSSRAASWSRRIACEETHVLSDALPFSSYTRLERREGTIAAIFPWEEVDRACDGADIVVLTCPVHAHRDVLERVLPALSRPTIVGTLYAQGGFDWLVRDVCERLGLARPQHTWFGLKRFPYLCKAVDPGRSVRLMGRFPKIVAALHGPRRAEAKTLLRRMFGKPVVEVPSFLNCTLNISNQVLHPAISSPVLRHRPPGAVFSEPVPLYGSIDLEGASNMCALANEIIAVAARLEPLTGISLVEHIGADPGVWMYLQFRRWLGRHFEGWRPYEVARDLCVATSIRHNRRLEQAMIPMVPGPRGEGLRPNFGSRFWLDDIPHGLCVVLGLGAIVGVQMPRARQLVLEHQAHMGKRYLGEDGSGFGPELHETNAPQRYGIHDREGLAKFLATAASLEG